GGAPALPLDARPARQRVAPAVDDDALCARVEALDAPMDGLSSGLRVSTDGAERTQGDAKRGARDSAGDFSLSHGHHLGCTWRHDCRPRSSPLFSTVRSMPPLLPLAYLNSI